MVIVSSQCTIHCFACRLLTTAVTACLAGQEGNVRPTSMSVVQSLVGMKQRATIFIMPTHVHVHQDIKVCMLVLENSDIKQCDILENIDIKQSDILENIDIKQCDILENIDMKQ